MLESSDRVARVLYPGLDSHDTHMAAKDLTGGKGYGAMITFDLAGSTPETRRKNRDKFISAVYPEIRLIPTLGDNHTILMPVEAVWGTKYPEPGMIRMSVGYEETDRLLEVIGRGLKG